MVSAICAHRLCGHLCSSQRCGGRPLLRPWRPVASWRRRADGGCCSTCVAGAAEPQSGVFASRSRSAYCARCPIGCARGRSAGGIRADRWVVDRCGTSTQPCEHTCWRQESEHDQCCIRDRSHCCKCPNCGGDLLPWTPVQEPAKPALNPACRPRRRSSIRAGAHHELPCGHAAG